MIEHPCCGCCGFGCFCGGGGHSHGRCYIPQVPHVSGGEDRRERGRVGHRPSGKRELCQRGAVAALNMPLPPSNTTCNHLAEEEFALFILAQMKKLVLWTALHLQY